MSSKARTENGEAGPGAAAAPEPAGAAGAGPEPAGRAPDAVIRAVARCFRRLGYGGTSLRAVSEETGLGRSSLYHYFPGGKEEMALAAIGLAQAIIDGPVADALRAQTAPGTRLGTMLDLLSDYYEDGALGCLLGALAAADCPPAVHRELSRLARSWINGIAGFLSEAGHPEPEAAAARLVAALQGGLVMSAATGDQAHFHAALADVRNLLPAPASGQV